MTATFKEDGDGQTVESYCTARPLNKEADQREESAENKMMAHLIERHDLSDEAKSDIKGHIADVLNEATAQIQANYASHHGGKGQGKSGGGKNQRPRGDYNNPPPVAGVYPMADPQGIVV